MLILLFLRLGGVVLSCNDGKSKCANTFAYRIELAFQEFLPDIRESLFDNYEAAY